MINVHQKFYISHQNGTLNLHHVLSGFQMQGNYLVLDGYKKRKVEEQRDRIVEDFSDRGIEGYNC